MMSRQATKRTDGRERKSLFLDIKKAHLAPKYEKDVYVELPVEAEVKAHECGKLIHWLYGCSPAASALRQPAGCEIASLVASVFERRI